MTNRDILNRGQSQEIATILGFLLMDYYDRVKVKHISSPINIVTVYKDFLEQETLLNTELCDKIYPKHSEIAIDAEYREVEEEKESDLNEKILELLEKYASKYALAKEYRDEHIYQGDSVQLDVLKLVSDIFDLYVD